MNKERKNGTDASTRVEWIGVDGALVALFIVLAAIYGYGLLNKVDFIIGIFAPGVAVGITTITFLKYVTEVVHFSKENRKK